MPARDDIDPRAGEEWDNSQTAYEAIRMIRLGVAAFIQTVTEGSPFHFYGPSFEVVIIHTDPAADYPGNVNNVEHRWLKAT